MHGRSKIASLAALVALAGGLTTMAPSAAAATTLWVSNSKPSAPFDTCEHPGYDRIQEALAGPGTAIHVCAGTYAEQLTIERSVSITGYGGATVALPAVTGTSQTPCDEVSAEASGRPDQDAISVCGEHVVSIADLKVDAVWPGEPVGAGVSCAYNLNGILVAGGADLQLSGSTVIGARPHTLNGCQYGVGVQIGMSYTKSLGAGTAKLSGDAIEGYDKNGITVEGAGSQAAIARTTVTGAGPTAETAQNGIGVQFGAQGTITRSTVIHNECENPTCGPDALSQYAADGVYFYEAAPGSSVTRTVLYGNDVGAEAFDPTSTDPTISRDRLEHNRYAGVEIGAGDATVDKDAMRESEVGVELLQFVYTPEGGSPQAYVGSGTAIHDTIEDMSRWAVLGRSDQNPEDAYGAFSITKSKISGNPGPRPLESVESENPTKLRVFAERDR
jgi:nitrous oxidase accessory protein NosD